MSRGLPDCLSVAGKVGIDVLRRAATAKHERHIRTTDDENLTTETAGVQMEAYFAEITLDFIVLHMVAAAA